MPLVPAFEDFVPQPGTVRAAYRRRMTDETRQMSILSVPQCWDLLSGTSLGRLVTSVDGNPGIFPVNFAVQERTILFRTASGTKLVSSAINDSVLFEADGYDREHGWSVIVAGVARLLRSDEEISEAERAALVPWTGSDKEHFVRIRPRGVTGRRFPFVGAPAQPAAVEDPVLG